MLTGQRLPLAQACEFFILELTLRAWGAAEETKRRTLQRSDIATAIARTDIFDFLVSRQEARAAPLQRSACRAAAAAAKQVAAIRHQLCLLSRAVLAGS